MVKFTWWLFVAQSVGCRKRFNNEDKIPQCTSRQTMVVKEPVATRNLLIRFLLYIVFIGKAVQCLQLSVCGWHTWLHFCTGYNSWLEATVTRSTEGRWERLVYRDPNHGETCLGEVTTALKTSQFGLRIYCQFQHEKCFPWFTSLGLSECSDK